MRLAMILGALGLMFLLPFSEAAASQRQQDRATAQQPRSVAPQAQRAAAPATRQAAQPQRATVPRHRQAAQAQAARQRPLAAQAQAGRQRPQAAPARAENARQQTVAPAAAQRTGLFRTAAAAPAGMPRAAASCARRDAQGRCIRTTASNTRWQGGLPPMTMAQQECPSGTVATLARGHANVVRCLPI